MLFPGALCFEDAPPIKWNNGDRRWENGDSLVIIELVDSITDSVDM